MQYFAVHIKGNERNRKIPWKGPSSEMFLYGGGESIKI